MNFEEELKIAEKVLAKHSYQVYSMYLQGMAVSMIAKDLGISYSTATYIVRTAKVRIEKYKKRQATNELMRKESTEELLNRSIHDLPNLNSRVIKACRRLGIVTIQDLVRHTEEDFLYTHNFGEGSLKQLKAALNQWGLSLGMKVRE